MESPERSLTWLPVDLDLEEALGPVLHPHGRPSASPPGHKAEKEPPQSLPRSLPPHPGLRLQRGGSASAPSPAAGETRSEGKRFLPPPPPPRSRARHGQRGPSPSFQPLPRASPRLLSPELLPGGSGALSPHGAPPSAPPPRRQAAPPPPAAITRPASMAAPGHAPRPPHKPRPLPAAQATPPSHRAFPPSA